MVDNISYKVLLENLFDGVYYVDKLKKITFWNSSAERITGFKKSEVLGLSCADNILCHIDIAGKELCLDGCPLHTSLEEGIKTDVTIFLHHKLGHRVPVHVRVAPILNKEGEIIGAIEVFSDNTKTLNMLQELEEIKKENVIDPLLNIGNRRYAGMIFDSLSYKLKAFEASFSLVLLDLDNFKRINDKFGHNIGDQVLGMVTRSLQNTMRGLDAIVRWGGDEFVLFLPNVSSSSLEDITKRIRMFVENSFIMVEDEKVSVTASLGATFAKDDDTLESLIKRVDKQMYVSKSKGGNCITID